MKDRGARADHVGRFERPLRPEAGRYEPDPVALAHLARTQLEAVRIEDLRDRSAQPAHVHGARLRGGELDRRSHFCRVRRIDDGHPRERAHQREVVDRLMRRPERRRDPRQEGNDDAAARAGRERHRDLVVGATRREDAVGDGDRKEADLREPAGDSHHVRLRHADLEEPIRERLGERQHVGVLGQVGREHDDVLAPAGEVDERRREGRDGAHCSILTTTSPTFASSPSETSTSTTVPSASASIS